MAPITYTTEWQQGPLPQGFEINLVGDYVTLVGANNAAKSSILQAIFRKFREQFNNGSKNGVCLILPERMFVHINTETGGRTLEDYNAELAGTIGANNSNRSYYAPGIVPASSELPKLLLNHWDFLKQAEKLNSYMRYFNLPGFTLSGPQEIRFEDIQVAVQGSGLRSIFAILAALTNKHIQLLLIDEPEQSLEAGVQKRLRDLFYLASQEGKKIIVTTHSHLFLNRKDFASNYAVSKENGQVSIRRVASQAELYDITFNMLGSSVEDLFFPYNYMIVEGSTDQIIVNKVMAFKGIGSDRVKVLAATGITNVQNILAAVQQTLIPLIVNDSPYAKRVVALVDKPNKSQDGTYEKLQKDLGDRLFTLTETSLEAYLPAYLYEKCGRSKDADMQALERLKGDHEGLRTLKTQIAKAVAGVLEVEDIANIPVFAEAVDKANG